MKVTLNHHTPLVVCANAIRTCWQSFDKSDNGGEKDRALIDRVGNKYKHASTIECLVYNFYIEGISRALLQELVRHRITSLSVKSTRYTMSKELKNEKPFLSFDEKKKLLHSSPEQIERASKYLVFTNIHDVDMASISALDYLRSVLKSGVSNDKAKYCLPESFKTELTWTINLRSLQNVLKLRLNKSALWEFQDLCCKIVQAMPKEHLFLIEDIVKEQIDGNQRIKELIEVFD